MKLHQLIALGAVTVFAGAVGAQTPPVSQPTQPSTSPSTGAESMGSAEFDKLDKDRDGSISKKEAASNRDLTKKWDTLDTNKDGKLDQGEFAQFEASGSAAPGASGSDKPSSTEKPKY